MLFDYKNKKIPEKAIILVSRELFYRLIYFFFCFSMSCCVSWIYGKEILYLYLYPLATLSQNVIFTGVSEAFTTTVYLCLYIGIVCSFPFFLYVFLCFFLPSLYPEEKSVFYCISFYIVFTLTTCIYICSGYIIPELCSWFLKYGVSYDLLNLSLQAKVSTYLSWTKTIYLCCMCILQLPLVFWFLLSENQKTSKIPPGGLFGKAQNRKYSSIFLLLFCAFISPPDLYSQGFIFFCCITIFECTLWFKLVQNTLNGYCK